VVKDNGSTVSDKRYIWVGSGSEERDAAGTTVLKRFFSQGVQEGASAYFFTRDHLGSIRELTDSAGVLQGRYDYDPFGRATRIGGTRDTDLGYTGHFRPAGTGPLFAPQRAYDADLGRWLNPDPIGTAGGVNTYGYVLNDPVNLVDPTGQGPVGAGVGAALGGALGTGVGNTVGAGIAAGIAAAAAETGPAAPAVAAAGLAAGAAVATGIALITAAAGAAAGDAIEDTWFPRPPVPVAPPATAQPPTAAATPKPTATVIPFPIPQPTTCPPPPASPSPSPSPEDPRRRCCIEAMTDCIAHFNGNEAMQLKCVDSGRRCLTTSLPTMFPDGSYCP
jgi:RHS repeat-associated protein